MIFGKHINDYTIKTAQFRPILLSNKFDPLLPYPRISFIHGYYGMRSLKIQDFILT